MLIAYITNLAELRTLAKIKQDYPIDPELYIDVFGLETINRSIPMFIKRSVFHSEETTISLIDKEGNDTLQVIFKHDLNRTSLNDKTDRNYFANITCHDYTKEQTIELYIDIQYGFTPIEQE